MSQINRTDPSGARDDLPSIADLSLPDDHINRQLAVRIEPDGTGVVGRFTVRPSMWGAGSSRPRLSILAMAIDGLAGQLPSPVRIPTIDLRAQYLSEPPSEGAVQITGRPLRVGRRLIVSEFEARDAAGIVFGRATTTMSNNHHHGYVPDDDVEPAIRIPSFDRLLDWREVDERSLDLDPTPQIWNGVIQTPHGGAQMLFCELAAEHLAGHGRAAVDIDIRFLQPGEVGPLRATAIPVGTNGGLDVFRIDLTDTGAGGALVAAVTIMSRPLEAHA
ncbi:MAG: hypothetical protein OXC31_28960 [Spirochaetaceae bacterium]|nr:hypothetical protein [Spirochaetaceae bacterium]